MSKQIRVDDPVYQKLDELRLKGETFSDVVSRLISSREPLCRLIDILEGIICFREWQREKREREAAAH